MNSTFLIDISQYECKIYKRMKYNKNRTKCISLGNLLIETLIDEVTK